MTRPPAEAQAPRGSDYVSAYVQYLYPQHLLSAMMYRITRLEAGALIGPFIRWFIRRYGVDMTLSTQPDPSQYPDFNAFFTRALRPDARPIPSDEDALLSPADGEISQLGDIVDGRLVQAKGRDYALQALLGGDAERCQAFLNGKFATIYLSPKDYHRVHMPVDGRLREMVHVPGRLFSVNRATTKVMPGLFAKNERVICTFDTAVGPLAVIMVGAIFVGSIQTVWHGEVTPARAGAVQRWGYDGSQTLGRGEEMGRFNMGSTVVLLLPPGSGGWVAGLGPGQGVRMGQIIGREKPGD